MDTEINQNTIIGHVAGLTEHTKNDFFTFISKSQLINMIEIVDVDQITTKIIEDVNMEKLFGKFEYYSARIKDINLSQTENKTAQIKSKELEKKMFQYWKVRMEYYINKLTTTSNKKILLIGYLSFFKNHRIYLNLNIVPKFFLKVNYQTHAKSIIRYNLEHCKDEIIEGNFDLNYLNNEFLIKKRTQLQNIYSKISYIVMNMTSIVNTLELFSQVNIPSPLYYASFVKYEKKIPCINNINLITYHNEWLALSSILPTLNNLNKINDDLEIEIEKGVNAEGISYIKITKDQAKKFSRPGYIYEITNTDYFLPFPTKKSLYKYFTVKPIKINRALQIDNILDQMKKLNIIIQII